MKKKAKGLGKQNRTIVTQQEENIKRFRETKGGTTKKKRYGANETMTNSPCTRRGFVCFLATNFWLSKNSKATLSDMAWVYMILGQHFVTSFIFVLFYLMRLLVHFASFLFARGNISTIKRTQVSDRVGSGCNPHNYCVQHTELISRKAGKVVLW